ncbi:hypothetical protein F511_14942 [Dorcoceras hygrometricum]|uniref:Uncharacterized protein n=1 Tax=Dorcoceras hygrometricum TaxID=472368 RepID=A0A2Z7DC80_9LAMI|nr:hypothetical protein F511_14942 [Dorcoceras hygrometricum]
MLVAGCPVVGREMLATGFPNDWFLATGILRLVPSCTTSLYLLRSSSQLRITDFFQSAMLTSTLLHAASSSRHADVINAESRFLFASIQQLISSFFALLIPDFYCSSSSSSFLQQTS